MSTATTRAVVLGGGGPVGRAWQSGLVAGFADGGIDLGESDLVVGTSAGAITGAEIALRCDMRGFVPAPPMSTSGVAAPAGRGALPPAVREMFAAVAHAAASDDQEAELRGVGRLALAAPTPPEAAAIGRSNLAVVAGRAWPPSFRATAVSVTTGRLRVLDADSGASLERALAASSALPGVWPPITIDGDRYMDGGVRSNLNADVAAGIDRVLVISCRDLELARAPEERSAPNRLMLRQVERLREEGAHVELLVPDDAFLELSGNGIRLLATELEGRAYELGVAQAARDLRRIAALFG